MCVFNIVKLSLMICLLTLKNDQRKTKVFRQCEIQKDDGSKKKFHPRFFIKHVYIFLLNKFLLSFYDPQIFFSFLTELFLLLQHSCSSWIVDDVGCHNILQQATNLFILHLFYLVEHLCKKIAERHIFVNPSFKRFQGIIYVLSL